MSRFLFHTTHPLTEGRKMKFSHWIYSSTVTFEGADGIKCQATGGSLEPWTPALSGSFGAPRLPPYSQNLKSVPNMKTLTCSAPISREITDAGHGKIPSEGSDFLFSLQTSLLGFPLSQLVDFGQISATDPIWPPVGYSLGVIFWGLSNRRQ